MKVFPEVIQQTTPEKATGNYHQLVCSPFENQFSERKLTSRLFGPTKSLWSWFGEVLPQSWLQLIAENSLGLTNNFVFAALS